jgi:hypothetical protein
MIFGFVHSEFDHRQIVIGHFDLVTSMQIVLVFLYIA